MSQRAPKAARVTVYVSARESDLAAFLSAGMLPGAVLADLARALEREAGARQSPQGRLGL